MIDFFVTTMLNAFGSFSVFSDLSLKFRLFLGAIIFLAYIVDSFGPFSYSHRL